jgi:hypothetical protein
VVLQPKNQEARTFLDFHRTSKGAFGICADVKFGAPRPAASHCRCRFFDPQLRPAPHNPKVLSSSLHLEFGAPGTNRTCDLTLRRGALYPLSYEGSGVILPGCPFRAFQDRAKTALFLCPKSDTPTLLRGRSHIRFVSRAPSRGAVRNCLALLALLLPLSAMAEQFDLVCTF